MCAAASGVDVCDTERQQEELQLLIVPESRTRNLLQNFGELFQRVEPATSGADTGFFWGDVFVERKLPWLRFLQSAACHALAIGLIYAVSRILALQPHAVPAPEFTHDQVVYYTPSEYLPPIDTRVARVAPAEKKTQAEHSAQPIISLPPAADNHSQTVIAAPTLKLHSDLALRNIIAWAAKPRTPIGPAPAVPASEISRLAPRVEQSVIAPPVDVSENTRRRTRGIADGAVIPPPPTAAPEPMRAGDFSIAHSTVIAPAPQLAVREQRARSAGEPSIAAEQVIAPPPSIGASATSQSSRNVIALNLHPAVTAPTTPIAGNRRGSFATTPEGHRGASGNTGGSENGSSSKVAKNSSGLPSGLYVGKAENSPATTNSNTINPNLIAGARPPRVSSRPLGAETENNLSQEERMVFGSRKFYSLSLNMPNLNSAGGSWIIRFAALKSDSTSSTSDMPYAHAAAQNAASKPQGDLTAPSARQKVDPAYPLELMRQNVAGTVILYAVIHSDGTVGNIRVLRSADERLDRYASQAIAKWQFDPATKSGAPVDVEATFWIPFRPVKSGAGF
jgi:TonB family protein